MHLNLVLMIVMIDVWLSILILMIYRRLLIIIKVLGCFLCFELSNNILRPFFTACSIYSLQSHTKSLLNRSPSKYFAGQHLHNFFHWPSSSSIDHGSSRWAFHFSLSHHLLFLFGLFEVLQDTNSVVLGTVNSLLGTVGPKTAFLADFSFIKLSAAIYCESVREDSLVSIASTQLINLKLN